MQSQVASAPAVGAANPTKRNFMVLGFFGLQALVIAIVSFSVFNGLLLKGCEEDARKALHLIAQEMDRERVLPLAEQGAADRNAWNLGAWVDDNQSLRHRLRDARIVQGQLQYHGYRFQWLPGEQSTGLLIAQPTAKGMTTYHLKVGPAPVIAVGGP